MDPVLRMISRCGDSKKNACRNLHNLIHKQGRTLPVEISVILTPVRVLCGKPKVTKANFPVLYLSSWAAQLFRLGGKLLLGGFSLDDEAGYRSMFSEFWQRFRYVRPDLDIYSESNVDFSMCIPIGMHGDEGRGKLKRPVLILAYQPIISHRGPGYTNSSGNLA